MIVPLVAVLAGASYLQYSSYRSLVMENLALDAANTGEIIEGSLLYAMLIHDFSTVHQIMDNIARQEGVQTVFLLDKDGEVLVSAGTRPTESAGMALSDATCEACHAGPEVRWNASTVLAAAGGDTFRDANAIENREGCQACHDPAGRTTGILITDFPMASVEAQLSTFRNRQILTSGGSVIVITVIVNAMMSRIVVDRLRQFLRVVRRVKPAELDARVDVTGSDEITELAEAFNRMADGLEEKAILEQKVQEHAEELQAQTEKLSALNTLATTVGQSLDLREVLHTALDAVLDTMKLRAGWIVLRNDLDVGFEPMVSRGLPETIAHAHVQCAWSRSICSQVFERGRPIVFPEIVAHPCLAADFFRREGLAFRACVPLKSKDQFLGTMSLIDDAPGRLEEFREDALEMLTAFGRQIGVAIENASLYEELRQKEALRSQLLKRVITAQEEERKRVARELHDQMGQSLTSLIITLGVLGEADSQDDVRAYLQELRDTVAQTLKQVHDLSLELRPSVLDDLGLRAALRQYFKEYRDRFHLMVDFQLLGLESQRLAPELGTALYRIVQEALANVVRHAEATEVSVLLDSRGSSLKLIVEDDGQGFDIAQVMGSRLMERNLGLHGMQERASLLGGTLTIESTPGVGTSLFVEIPLPSGENLYGQDPFVGG